MGKQKISIKLGEFDILLERKKVKYLRLKINSECEISLSAPMKSSREEIENFVLKNEIWLKKTLAKIKNRAIPKNRVYFKGREFSLNLDVNSSGIKVNDDLITAPNSLVLDEFFRAEIKLILNEFIAKFAPLIGRDINHVSIKKMRTRWGSCNSKKGYINLNANLIKKDPRFIEYVVLHELTHLIYPHHQKSFYDFIEKIMPDFKFRSKL